MGYDPSEPTGVFNVKSYGALGNGATDDSAAIQLALNALPLTGGEIYFPEGTYFVGTSLPITITNPVKIHGAGQFSTTLSVASSVSGSTPVILVQAPTSTVLAGVEISDMNIVPVSGTPASSAITLDALTGGEVHSIYIHHLSIGQFGGPAILGTSNVGAGNGTPCFGARFEQSLLVGGISLPYAGDATFIDHNVITGNGKALDISFPVGVANLVFSSNYVNSAGGVHIGGGSQALKVIFNEFESEPGFTGSNSSMLDIDGASGLQAYNSLIFGNSFQMVNSTTANGLRLNYARFTIVEGNNFELGVSPAVDVLLTANSNNTRIGKNQWNSVTVAQAVSDSGSNNKYDFGTIPDQPTVFADNTGTGYLFGANGIAFYATNGANEIYSGEATPRVAGVFSASASALPPSGTWASFYNAMINGSATVKGQLVGAAGQPIYVQGGSGTTNDFVIYNAAVTRNNMIVDDAGNWSNNNGIVVPTATTGSTGTGNMVLSNGSTLTPLSVKASGASAALGFNTGGGAGSAVTQITSRTTGVTINTPTGAITLFSAAGSATAATFTVTDSAVAATDVIKICQKSGTNLYLAFVTAVAAGSFNVTFYTTGGTATDAPVFNFAIIKGSAN